jgi:6-pyruvoyltetrahydropterin/6-carboxytetrahydropterin synthase
MFIIAKEFKFDAGHRVYTQSLNPSLAQTSSCVCKHLHGHEFKVEVGLESESLDNKTQMVTDFKHLTFFKHILDNVFDHTFIFGKDDPILRYFINDFILKHTRYVNMIGILKGYKGKEVSVINLPDNSNYDKIINILNLYHAIRIIPSQDNDVFDEVGEITIISHVPTAENLAKLFYTIIDDVFTQSHLKQSNMIKVSYVKVYETSKSYAIYRR